MSQYSDDSDIFDGEDVILTDVIELNTPDVERLEVEVDEDEDDDVVPESKDEYKEWVENLNKYYKRLDEYFAIKQKYNKQFNKEKQKILRDKTKSRKEKRNAVKALKLTCIGCKNKVGMVFGNEDGVYTARCGGDVPCGKIDIQLQKGLYAPVDYVLDYEIREKEDIEREIVLLKLNLLFGFIDEETLETNFRDLIQRHNIKNKRIKYYEDFLKSKTRTEDRIQSIATDKEQLNAILPEIHDSVKTYLASGEETYLNEAMSDYVNEILPLLKNIRTKEYDYYKIEEEKEGSRNILRLVKKENILENTEHLLIGEEGSPSSGKVLEPKVIRFVVPRK